MPAEKTIFTLGTSNRSLEELVHLLRINQIEMVVDVRSFPTSKFPHFKKEALSRSLGEGGLGYFYLGKELGGYRKGGYEAYMQTDDFPRGVEILERMAARCRCVILCAERLPWHCHRRFIARSLEDRGWKTVHIIEEGKVGLPGRGSDG